MARIFLIFIALCACFSFAILHETAAVQAENITYAAAQATAGFPAQDTLKQQGKKYKKRGKAKSDAKSDKVTTTRNVDRATLSKRSEAGRQVEVRIMRSGSVLRDIADLQLTGNSGSTNTSSTNTSSTNTSSTNTSSTNTSSSFVGFENMEFPFEGTVRFKAPNKMNSVVYDREVQFTVAEPGSWTLKIDI